MILGIILEVLFAIFLAIIGMGVHMFWGIIAACLFGIGAIVFMYVISDLKNLSFKKRT